MVTHLQVVSVPVSDQDRAKTFYVDVLGFEVRNDSRFGPDQRWVELAPPGAPTSITLVTWFPSMPPGSVFRSLREASEFFREGSVGFSPGVTAGHFDGLELRTANWSMQPLVVEAVESSFFNDPRRFPPGSVEFDCALLMRQVQHEWCQKPSLCCEPAAV